MSRPFPLPGFTDSPCDQARRVDFSRCEDFAEMWPYGWGIFGGDLGLMTMCPKCGTRQSLAAHTVSAMGEVNASYLCAKKDCGYHVFIRLGGWDKGEKPANTDWNGSGWATP